MCSCHFQDGKKENYPKYFNYNEGKLFTEHYLTPEKRKPRGKSKKSVDSLHLKPQALFESER